MLLDSSFPPDRRVEKEATSLINSNLFNVFVLCLKQIGESDSAKHDGVNIIRINSPAMDQKVKKGIFDSFYSINHFHRAFFNSIIKLNKEYNFDAIHIHDLPLAKTGRIAANKINIPYVLDYHENYAEGLKIWFKWRTNPIIKIKNKIFFNYKKWSKFEKKESLRSSNIIAVVEEMKQRLVSQYGLIESKVTVVSNTEPIDFHDESINIKLPKKLENKFLITYIGGIGPHRGIDTAIKAMTKIRELSKDILLLIIGGGSQEVINTLKSIIEEKKLHESVILFGKVDSTEVSFYMKKSHINIIPHHSNEHTDNTIPHKLFQILLSKQPLLVSDSSPLKRIVENFNAGYIHQASQPDSFTEKVLEIYNDYNRAKEKAMNGFDACVNKGLNWEKSGSDLISLYKKILKI